MWEVHCLNCSLLIIVHCSLIIEKEVAMKHSRRVGALISCLIFLLTGPLSAQEAGVVIRGGWLFDSVGDEVVRNTGIVINGGKFLQVGADLSSMDLAGFTTLELTENDFILPGIFDLHAHYNVNLVGKGRKDEYRVNPTIFLANGVTSTFPAGEYNPEDMMALRKRVDSGEQIGPRIYNSGPYFGSAREGWNKEASREEIFRDVDFWVEQGVAGFKAKGIGPVQLQALITRAHQHGLTVTGHLGSGFKDSVNPRDAILMGIDRIEHFLGGDALPADKPAYSSLVDFKPGTTEFEEIADLFITHGVYFDATITAYGYYGNREEGFDYWIDESKFYTPFVHEYLSRNPPRRTSERFGKIYWVKRKTIKAFYEAGGEKLITLGTDHPSTGEFIAGFSAHREIDAFVLSEITPAAAIKMATINGANAMNVGSKLGSIEPGKFADLFIITGNPLTNIRNTRNVHTVMKAGKIYDSKALLDSVVGKMGPSQ